MQLGSRASHHLGLRVFRGCWHTYRESTLAVTRLPEISEGAKWNAREGYFTLRSTLGKCGEGGVE